MLDEIYKWFQVNGVDRIELDVINDNIPAGSFWEKQGFIEFKHILYRNIQA